MNNSLVFSCELGATIGVSNIIASSVDATPLITAIITFGVSIVTLVGGELVKYLVTLIQTKTKQLKEEQKKEGEHNE